MCRESICGFSKQTKSDTDPRWLHFNWSEQSFQPSVGFPVIWDGLRLIWSHFNRYKSERKSIVLAEYDAPSINDKICNNYNQCLGVDLSNFKSGNSATKCKCDWWKSIRINFFTWLVYTLCFIQSPISHFAFGVADKRSTINSEIDEVVPAQLMNDTLSDSTVCHVFVKLLSYNTAMEVPKKHY